eukprot:Nk52_evm12s2209 gene=Nk52_evmTU12s2209
MSGRKDSPMGYYGDKEKNYDSEATEDENEGGEGKIAYFDFAKGTSKRSVVKQADSPSRKPSPRKKSNSPPKKESTSKAKPAPEGADPDETEDEEEARAKARAKKQRSKSPAKGAGANSDDDEMIRPLAHKRGQRHERVPEFASEFDDKRRKDLMVSKEMRRKRQRIEAEQRRRDRMKDGIDEIRNIVPDEYLDEFRGESIRELSQYSILKAASNYIKVMNEKYDLSKVDELKRTLQQLQKDKQELEEKLDDSSKR